MADAPNSTVATLTQAFQMQNKRAATEKFAILLVGPANFCDTLKNSILDANSKQSGYEMTVHCCEFVEDILLTAQTCHADYIVFLLDTTDPKCVESVVRSISVVESVYLCSRMCLVNCTSVSPLNMGVDQEQIYNLVDNFSVLLLNSDIKNDAEREFLSDRILYLSSSVCGFKTGYPLVFDLPNTKVVT